MFSPFYFMFFFNKKKTEPNTRKNERREEEKKSFGSVWNNFYVSLKRKLKEIIMNK